MKYQRFFTAFISGAAFFLMAGCGSEKQAEEVEVSDAETDASMNEASENEIAFETASEKISYIIGYNTAMQYVNDPALELDREAIIQGVLDAMEGEEPGVSQAEVQEASQELQAKQKEIQAAEAEKAKAVGVAFLAENGKKEGIMTTESGLQYEVLKKGESDKSPVATDSVTVHYHGTRIDGGVFDSSVDKGSPATFRLNGVIKGWTEGLQLMNVGDKFKFYIPSEMAYGARSPSRDIPPHSTLIFEVELISIN
ncbi:MAG: FKBP-type peptidyl-prolyl cis-trans isomerase [Verrucomicrobiota bacterium]